MQNKNPLSDANGIQNELIEMLKMEHYYKYHICPEGESEISHKERQLIGEGIKKAIEIINNYEASKILTASHGNVLFSRIWEMPNSNTFDIKCINKLIHKYHKPEMLSIDPFANRNRIAKITNDLDPDMNADYCMDALDFLKQFDSNSVDFVLYDPPYSPRQVSECYRKLGKTVNMETTQASFWGNLKKEIARVTKPNGIVISFGWNTNGIGKTKNFEIIEIMAVSHGGQHNDTLCTVERKINGLFD